MNKLLAALCSCCSESVGLRYLSSATMVVSVELLSGKPVDTLTVYCWCCCCSSALVHCTAVVFGLDWH